MGAPTLHILFAPDKYISGDLNLVHRYRLGLMSYIAHSLGPDFWDGKQSPVKRFFDYCFKVVSV